MSLKGAYTLPSLWSSARHHSSWRCKFPHLNSLVQTAANKVPSVWCESNAVNTVSMAIRALEALNQVSSGSVPDTNALIKRSGSYVAAVWRNSNSGNAVFDAENEFLFAIDDIPETDSLITTSGSDVAAVSGKVERINILFMSGEDVFDCAASNVPDLLEKRLAKW